MKQEIKEAAVDASVAPGIRVGLRLEQREVETLHVALAIQVARRIEAAELARSPPTAGLVHPRSSFL